MLVSFRKYAIYPAILALSLFCSSCSSTTEDPSSSSSNANLAPVKAGPESPPALTINGTKVAAVSYDWKGTNKTDFSDDPPSIKDIEKVSLDPTQPKVLNIRLNESVPPYYSLIRQCSKLDTGGYPDLSSCSYIECTGEEQCFHDAESGIEFHVELLFDAKFVTIMIQYPNDTGWDAEATENPDNYANYSVFLEQN